MLRLWATFQPPAMLRSGHATGGKLRNQPATTRAPFPTYCQLCLVSPAAPLILGHSSSVLVHGGLQLQWKLGWAQTTAEALPNVLLGTHQPQNHTDTCHRCCHQES